MKHTILSLIITLALLGFGANSRAADTNTLETEFNALMTKIHGKLQGGMKSEADFADELKAFDSLAGRHKDAKPDQLAEVLVSKAMLYQRIFKDKEKGDAVFQQIKTDYPDSEVAQNLKRQDESKKIQENLKPGAKFPDFSEKDVAGKPVSIANYKGKVVLLDFWATWCGPCVGELPNVIETYKKHHEQGFEIIGISLDQDQDKLTSFVDQRKMTWQQFFDGKGWQNKLATKYGVQSIPATFLLDGEGKIIARDLRGEALEDAVSQALAKK